MTHKPFTFVELFAGIGGFRQGLEQIGGECVLASEIDRFANISYKALYGHATIGDIFSVHETEVPDHDIIVGGFPCQAFSVAGLRGGFNDARGTLFFEVLRIANEKRPKAIFLENVKGLVSHDKGKTLDTMVTALSEIGYVVDFEILNSKHFGVPQNRERIFIVAFREDLVNVEMWNPTGTSIIPQAKQRMLRYEGLKTFNFDWPKNLPVTKRLRDVLEPSVPHKFYLSHEKTAKLVAQLTDKAKGEKSEFMVDDQGRKKKLDPLKVSPTLRRESHGNEPKMVEPTDGLPILENTKKGYTNAQEGDAVNFKFPSSKTRRGRVGKQIAQTLEATNIQQGVVVRQTVIDDTQGFDGIRTYDDMAPTLRSTRQGLKIFTAPLMLGHVDVGGHDILKRVYSPDGQSPTLSTMQGGGQEPKIAEEQFDLFQWMMVNTPIFASPSWVSDPYVKMIQEDNSMAEEVRPVSAPDMVNKQQNGQRFKDNDAESFTLTARDKHGVLFGLPRINIVGNVKPETATRHGQRDDVYGTDGIMGAINASDWKQPRPVFGQETRYRIRKLTPLECFRLQGFPDEAHHAIKSAGISDSQLYKQAGNAVTVTVIKAIGERIVESMNKGKQAEKKFLSDDEREGMIETLAVLGTKSEDYYRKCSDTVLDAEYRRLTP